MEIIKKNLKQLNIGLRGWNSLFKKVKHAQEMPAAYDQSRTSANRGLLVITYGLFSEEFIIVLAHHLCLKYIEGASKKPIILKSANLQFIILSEATTLLEMLDIMSLIDGDYDETLEDEIIPRLPKYHALMCDIAKRIKS